MSQSSLINPPNHSVGEDARRSTRIERSVPLIVFGQNRMGEPFVERTVSTSLNLHGCRYPSRHDYGVGSWVTMQVVGLSVEPKPPAVRARVRSVHTAQSSRELQQVGVELENPGNVWGIVTPPQDWMSAGGTNTAMAQLATAAAPAPDHLPMTVKLDEWRRRESGDLGHPVLGVRRRLVEFHGHREVIRSRRGGRCKLRHRRVRSSGAHPRSGTRGAQFD